MKIYFELRPDEKNVRSIDVAHALIDSDLSADMLDEIAEYLRVYVLYHATPKARPSVDLPNTFTVNSH